MAVVNIPTSRKEISDRIASDVKSRLPDSDPFLQNSYLQSLIFGIAGRDYDIYQKINIMIKQFFPDTSEDDFIQRWGGIYGLSRNPATQSKGLVTFSGLATTIIANGTLLQNSSGIQYTTQTDATISTNNLVISSISRSGSIVTVNFSSAHNLASGIIIDNITGVTPVDFNTTNQLILVTSPTQIQYTLAGTIGAGSGGNAQWTTASVEVKSVTSGAITQVGNGGSLNLTTPISGSNNTVFVQFTQIGGGTDVENNTDYLARILDRIQNPFSFFNKNAIALEAKKVSGVTRVFVFSPDNVSSSKPIVSITRVGQIATVNSLTHGLADGSFITITGAVQPEYNVTQKRVIVIDLNNFAFVINGSPVSPATGTISFSYSFVELGQVRVYPLRDKDDSIIPTAEEINDIKNQILNILPAHMAASDLIVQAPTAKPINFLFSSLSPNNSTMQTAINSAIDGYFRSANQVGVTVKLNSLQGLINDVIDGSGASPIYTLSSPSVDTVMAVDEIGTKGTITYP